MKRFSFVLALLLLVTVCFARSEGATADERGFYDRLFSDGAPAVTVESEAAQLDEEGDVFVASEIPRIGGVWNYTATGTIDNSPVNRTGTGTFTTYVAADGHEVVTQIQHDTGQPQNTGSFKITSRFFVILRTIDIRDEFTIENEVRIVRHTYGRDEAGKYGNVTIIYTRGTTGESAGGGGCSTGASAPFIVLLCVPLF